MFFTKFLRFYDNNYICPLYYFKYKCYNVSIEKIEEDRNLMIKLLIVEDDENIRRMLEVTASIAGYEYDTCDNGLRAAEKIKESDYDLVLLDVMLPGCSGFEVVEKIDTERTPVIFLTALQDVTDKVRGLKLGAEDYVVKPFEPVELLARIEVILRRKNKHKTVLEYGDIIVDVARHIVKKNDRDITLTPREFELFVYFLKNIDIALSRERLLSAVWGYEFTGETRTVDTHVQQLRKKLEIQNSLITVPKLGYRLENID